MNTTTLMIELAKAELAIAREKCGPASIRLCERALAECKKKAKAVESSWRVLGTFSFSPSAKSAKGVT